MKKESAPIFVLFGIFYLREQIHNYLDVFEERAYIISRYLGAGSSMLLVEGKQKMLRNSYQLYSQLRHTDIKDPNLFEPVKMVWIDASEVEDCLDKDVILQKFIDYNQSAMKWCYWFLSEDNVDLQTSQFLLEVITASKKEIELLSAAFKK